MSSVFFPRSVFSVQAGASRVEAVCGIVEEAKEVECYSTDGLSEACRLVVTPICAVIVGNLFHIGGSTISDGRTNYLFHIHTIHVLTYLQKPISLNLTTLIQFVTLTIINTPPNFLWQQYLEASYPGVTPSSEARYLEQQQTSESGSAAYLGDLDVGNTVTKFLLDQSVGAVVNSIMFLAVIGALKGKSVSGIFRSVRQVSHSFMRLNMDMDMKGSVKLTACCRISGPLRLRDISSGRWCRFYALRLCRLRRGLLLGVHLVCFGAYISVC